MPRREDGTTESRNSAEVTAASDAVKQQADYESPTETWITPDLVDRTLEIWQPYYSYRLTRHDAIVIIKNVGRLFEVMSRGAKQ